MIPYRTTLLISLISLLLFSCTKTRVQPPPPNNIVTLTPLINEFLAKNSLNLCPDSSNYSTSDWIEIYNPNSNAIDIGGYFFTDSIGNPTKFKLITNNANLTTIPVKGFLIVWCDGLTHLGSLHTNFSLSKNGEQIGFFAADTTIIDTLTFGAQTQDISYGRTFDGSATWKYFLTPTPKATNQ